MSGKTASVSRAKASGKPAVECGPKRSDEGRRKQRSPRSASLPVPPEDRTLDYALSRPELADIEPGEVVLATEKLEGFKKVVLPALKAADKARLAPREGESKRRGRVPSYNAIDYWRLEMLRRVIASHSTQATRDWLTTDKAARTRELLGFDKRRAHYGGKPKKWMDGIPSDGWMSDFRTKWLSEESVADLMQKLERWALAEKLATLPWMREECRTLHADGSKLETHATAPKTKKDKNGKVRVLNKWKKGRDGKRVPAITAPEAGYVSNSRGNNADHSGHGWNIVTVMSSKGTVLAHRNVPLNTSEKETLAGMAGEVGQALTALRKPKGAQDDSALDPAPESSREAFEVLHDPELRVLSTDAAFHSQEMRRAWRSVGVVENTHLSSHANRPSSKRTVKDRDKKRYAIDGHPDWFATGHRGLVCRCGKGKVSRLIGLDKRGRAMVRAQGECPTCKNVLITSGWWRLSENTKFVRCLPKDRHKDAHLEFGNPLTFHDSLSAEYGRQRFNGQEGVFGSQFTQRFKLLKSKRWFYRQSQVDLEVAAVITITHALSLERWRRMGEPKDTDDGDGDVGAGSVNESSQAVAA